MRSKLNLSRPFLLHLGKMPLLLLGDVLAKLINIWNEAAKFLELRSERAPSKALRRVTNRPEMKAYMANRRHVTHTHIHTHRERERQRDRETERERQRERQTSRESETERVRERE